MNPDTSKPGDSSVPEPEQRSRPTWAIVGVAIVGAVIVTLFGFVFLSNGDDSEPRTIEVTVPAGTAERIAKGERIELLPRRLEVNLGDTLVIDNRDDAGHQVGPYVVGPNQRIEQRFVREGVIEGICTLHPSGQVSIVVG